MCCNLWCCSYSLRISGVIFGASNLWSNAVGIIYITLFALYTVLRLLRSQIRRIRLARLSTARKPPMIPGSFVHGVRRPLLPSHVALRGAPLNRSSVAARAVTGHGGEGGERCHGRRRRHGVVESHRQGLPPDKVMVQRPRIVEDDAPSSSWGRSGGSGGSIGRCGVGAAALNDGVFGKDRTRRALRAEAKLLSPLVPSL